MPGPTRIASLGLLCLMFGALGPGQRSAELQTSDTALVLEAAPAAPRLTSLVVPGQHKWGNRFSEELISFAELSGKPTSLHWTFSPEAGSAGGQRVAFAYESPSPGLWRAWKWRTRQTYGPIEHPIRIENHMLRSGMMGWFTLMLDTDAWSAGHHAEAKQEVDLYKKQLRPLMRDASLYHVSPRPDGGHWDAIQYRDANRQGGVVDAFRGTVEAEKEDAFWLTGLQASGRYFLNSFDPSAPDRTVNGRELHEAGSESVPFRAK